MARKPVKINPNRGKRVKELIKRENIDQATLAALIPISKQTISKIVNNKSNLTEDTARRIIKKFPNYSFEWLMAYDLEPLSFDSPVEFEKNWIRQGGGAHPLNNQIVVEARIGVALEKLNENGWRIAVNMIESLCSIPEFQAKEEEKR